MSVNSQPADESLKAENISRVALERLAGGEVDDEFTDLLEQLASFGPKSDAMTEGVLLFAGSELHIAAEQAIQRKHGKEVREKSLGKVLVLLSFAESSIEARGLSLMGGRIVEHCQTLSTDYKVMAALDSIIKSADEA